MCQRQRDRLERHPAPHVPGAGDRVSEPAPRGRRWAVRLVVDAEHPAGQILYEQGNALQEEILELAAGGEGETACAGDVVGPAGVDETRDEE